MANADVEEGNNKKSKRKEDAEPRVPIKKTSDFIKLKLDKLMTNFDKPVTIPERPKQKSGPNVPEFVRNVMGSSAGAGSGEFHVYRHLRRKEYARQKFIQLKSEAEQKDEEYHKKLEENAKLAQEATAKKRSKRMKRKERKKKSKKTKLDTTSKSLLDTVSDHSEEEESEDEEQPADGKIET